MERGKREGRKRKKVKIKERERERERRVVGVPLLSCSGKSRAETRAI